MSKVITSGLRTGSCRDTPDRWRRCPPLDVIVLGHDLLDHPAHQGRIVDNRILTGADCKLLLAFILYQTSMRSRASPRPLAWDYVQRKPEYYPPDRYTSRCGGRHNELGLAEQEFFNQMGREPMSRR